MAVVTLLTDFGTRDEYAGVMKGVILSVNPAATVVDISHHVPAHDVRHASTLLAAAYPYFPPGTVHLVVVDPGVGGRRAAIAFACGGHLFVGPDNGVFSAVLGSGEPTDIVRIENPVCSRTPLSRTFHGRDLFAPAAARLSAGVGLARLGPPIGPREVTCLPLAEVRLTPTGQLEGEVVSIDGFGNLMTNITGKRLADYLDSHPDSIAVFQLGGYRIEGLVESYESAADQRPLAIIGSRGAVEIAVNQESAQRCLMAAVGDVVRVDAAPTITRKGSGRG